MSPFAFEVGGRYWYSSGRLNFGFANGNPLFGNPTSTLDWRGLSAHSGEVFARIDHIPSGVFVKGLVGLGTVIGGHIDDLDFLVTQFKFSDTTSDVHNGNLSYGMLDVGWAYSPTVGVRLGFFAGYHFWHEKVTAYGIVCNMASFIGCPAAGAVIEGFGIPVLSYEPTVHAARIGVEGRIAVDGLVVQRRDRRRSLCGVAEQGQPSAAAEHGGSWTCAERHHQEPIRLRHRERSVPQLCGDAQHRNRRRACAIGA